MQNSDQLKIFRLKTWLVLSAILLVIVAILAARYEKRHLFFLKRDLISQAEGVAAALSFEKLQELKFDSTDITNYSYRNFHKQFKKYADEVNIRSLYSVKSIDGKLVFGPENLESNDSFASPPGTVYEQPPTALFDVFASGQSRSFGPYKDEYGSFVSAFAPVINPIDNQVYMVVGIDMTADQWTRGVRILRLQIAVYYGLLLLALILVAFFIYLQQNNSERLPGWYLRYSELILTASAGLFVTFTAALQMYDIEHHQNKALFREMAKDKKNVVRTALSYIEKNTSDSLLPNRDSVKYQSLLLVDQSDAHIHDALMHQHLIDITDSVPKCLAHLPVHNCHFDVEGNLHPVVAAFPIFFGERTLLFKAYQADIFSENHSTNSWLWAAAIGVLATLMSMIVLRQIKEKQNFLEREVAIRTAELRLSNSALEMANQNLEETITKALEIVASSDGNECSTGINEVSKILNRK